jgi:shikimate 5-dehydrogenase
MHLVAVVGGELNLYQRAGRFRDPAGQYLLHPLSPTGYPQLAAGLRTMEFAGALLFDAALQREAATAAERTSLLARTLGAADVITPTMAGMVADLTYGRAVVAALQARVWSARGARVAVLGSNLAAQAVARELASQGITHLSILAAGRADAERVSASLGTATEVAVRAAREPTAGPLLERADLVVRADSTLEMASELFGPHLTLVDLTPEPMTRWRQLGVEAGALTIGARDVLAQRLQLAIGATLGTRVALEPLLAWLHEDSGDSSLSSPQRRQ